MLEQKDVSELARQVKTGGYCTIHTNECTVQKMVVGNNLIALYFEDGSEIKIYVDGVDDIVSK